MAAVSYRGSLGAIVMPSLRFILLLILLLLSVGSFGMLSLAPPPPAPSCLENHN